MRKIRPSQIPSVWSKTGFLCEIRRRRGREGCSCNRRVASKGSRGATTHKSAGEPMRFTVDGGSAVPEAVMFGFLGLAGFVAILLAMGSLTGFVLNKDQIVVKLNALPSKAPQQQSVTNAAGVEAKALTVGAPNKV